MSAKTEDALFYNAYCYYLDSPPSSLDQKAASMPSDSFSYLLINIQQVSVLQNVISIY